jgi:hypothetical protein
MMIGTTSRLRAGLEKQGQGPARGRHDFENEFQFQLQGYAPAGRAVNQEAHNPV